MPPTDGMTTPSLPVQGRNSSDFFNRAQEDAKPRDICNKLNDVAFIAAKTGNRLIDEDCLRAGRM